MASRYLVATGPNIDWGSTSSWSATDGGSSGAAVPANGDDVYIKQGTGFINGTLDQSAVTLGSLTIMGGFGEGGSSCGIGTSSASLKINVTNALTVTCRRMQFFKLDGTIGTIDLKAIGGCNFFHSGGASTTFRVGREGYYEVEDDVEITNFTTAGAGGIIKGDSTSATDLMANVSQGASVEIWRKIHTLSNAGSVTTRYAAVGSAGSGTSRWYNHGKLDVRQSGNIANLVAFAGSRSTWENSPGFATPPTVAIEAHEGASIIAPAHLVTATITGVGVVSTEVLA